MGSFGFLLIFGDFFLESQIYLSFNRGASFGISVFPLWFILFISTVVLFLIFFLFLRSLKKKNTLFVWQTCIFFGGLSNFIDRARFGGVNDYWSFFGLWSFNLADVFLILGVFGWVLISLLQGGKVKEL